MATTTTTLSFFTIPKPTKRTPFNHPSSLFSKTINPITSNTLTLSQKITILPPVKLSNTEAPVIDVEPTPIAETPEEEEEEAPKKEHIFAVVMIGSRQYIVFPGRYLTTQRLKGANVNDKIILSKVLLVGTKTTTYIGQPVVTNAAVHAVVEDVGLNPKVIVYKYKKRKNYRRNIGHRQPNTRIRITGITGYEDFPAVTLDSLKQTA